MRFEFATATRIIFGAGTLSEVGRIATDMGRRALVVTGRGRVYDAPLLNILEDQGVIPVVFTVENEPTTENVREGVRQVRDFGCNMVVGFGGGSAIDAGKAIAAMMTNGGDPLDYVEVIGHGLSLNYPSAPYIAIPTTAGTGSEVTSNAVLLSPEHRVKVSLRSPLMLPRLAVVDPELTYTLPQDITATTGLDALTQLMEPFVSNRANPLTDTLTREGIRRAARSLRCAWEDCRDPNAREDMSLASLFGGLALANAKLGAVHGFASPLGGMFPAPHGAVCARLLPYVMEANVKALRERDPESAALGRYDEIGQILTGDPDARAEDGITWVRDLVAVLRIPPLSLYGVSESIFPELIERASAASSMQGNPVKLTPDEMREVLMRAL